MAGDASMELHRVRTGQRGRPAVVLLHGFLGSHADWHDLMNFFASRFDVVAVDLPGHGKSIDDLFEAPRSDHATIDKVGRGDSPSRCSDTSATSMNRHSMPGAAQAVLQCMDAESIETATIVGYSMGGRLALYLAMHAPERCQKVVMESSSPGLLMPNQAAARVRADEAWARRFETEPLSDVLTDWYAQPIFSTLTNQSEIVEKMMQQRLQNEGRAVARSLRGMSVGAQTPLWDRLSELQRDVWVVTGERDAKYRQVAAEMMKRSPRIRSVCVPDAGHNAHAERPNAYQRVLEDIL